MPNQVLQFVWNVVRADVQQLALHASGDHARTCNLVTSSLETAGLEAEGGKCVVSHGHVLPRVQFRFVSKRACLKEHTAAALLASTYPPPHTHTYTHTHT